MNDRFTDSIPYDSTYSFEQEHICLHSLDSHHIFHYHIDKEEAIWCWIRESSGSTYIPRIVKGADKFGKRMAGKWINGPPSQALYTIWVCRCLAMPETSIWNPERHFF